MLTPEQVEVRQSGLGGSDIPALFGLAFNRRPIDVYLEKLGDAPPFEGNERTYRGSRLEALILEWFIEDYGGEPFTVPSTLRRTDRQWHLLTPDAIRGESGRAWSALENAITGASTSGPAEAIEIKSHGWHAAKGYGEEGTDDIPPHIRIQVAWYQGGLELDVMYVVALLDTHLLRAFPIYRDLELEGYLLEEAESFWRDHVLARRPPNPDGSDSFKRYLDQRWKDTGLEVEATSEVIDLAAEFRESRQAAADAKRNHEAVKQRLELALGPVSVATLDGRPLVTWKRDKQGRPKHTELIDELAKLANLTDLELEELVNNHRSEPTRRLLVKGPK